MSASPEYGAQASDGRGPLGVAGLSERLSTSREIQHAAYQTKHSA